MSAVVDRGTGMTGRLSGLSGRTIAWIGWFGLVGLGLAVTRPSLAATLGVLAAVSALTAGLLVAAMAQESGSPVQRTLRGALCAASPLFFGSMLWLATFVAGALVGAAGLPLMVLASLMLFAVMVVAETALAATVAVLLVRSTHQLPALIVAVLIADRFCGLLGETR